MLELITNCSVCPKFKKDNSIYRDGDSADCLALKETIWKETYGNRWFEYMVYSRCPLRHQNLVFRLDDDVQYCC